MPENKSIERCGICNQLDEKENMVLAGQVYHNNKLEAFYVHQECMWTDRDERRGEE